MKAGEIPKEGTLPKARGIDWFIALGLFLFFTVLYWLTISQDPTIDSYVTAAWVKSSAPLNWFHPHHLLFSYVCRFVNLVWSSVFLPLDLLMLLTRCMHILGGAAIAILYLRLSALQVPRLKAASLALLIGVSYGMWFFATIFELVIPYFLMFLAAWAAAHHRGGANRRGALTAGMVLGAGVLIHQTLLIYLPAFLIFIFMLGEHKTRWQRALYYLIGCVAVVCAGYITAFLVLGLDFPAGWFRFFTDYAQKEVFQHGTPADIVTSARHIVAIWLYPILYANPFSFRFIAAMLVLVVFAAVAVYRTARRDALSIFCLIVFATAFAFFTWWSPNTLDFYVIPAIMIVLPTLLLIKWRFISLVFVAMATWLFFFNNFPEIKDHAQKQYNCVLETVSNLKARLKPHDKIFWVHQPLDAAGAYLELPAERLLVLEDSNREKCIRLFAEYAKNASDYALYYDGLFDEMIKKSGILTTDKELNRLLENAKLAVSVTSCDPQLGIWEVKREVEPK